MLSRSAVSIYRNVFLRRKATKAFLLTHLNSAERKRLRKAFNLRGLGPKQRKGVRRFIEALVRKDKHYQFDARLQTVEDHLLLVRGRRSSPLLDAVFPERLEPGRWRMLRQRELNLDAHIDLENLSFLKNPAGVLSAFRSIAMAEASLLQAKINFKDSHCLDIVPFMLLVECWHEMMPIFDGGEMDIPMQKVLSAVGIEHALNVRFQGIEEYSNVWVFPLTRRRRRGETKSRNVFADVPTRDNAADRFCDAIDEWLGRPEIKLQLTKKGAAQIKIMLGELLENAERHSDGDRRDGSWSVSGFLERVEDNGELKYRANIGIVSLGDTFSVSLARAKPEQRERIETYVERVRRKGALQSVETLRTLVALQDGVTCVTEADDDDRGGYGLMEMLDLVSVLSGVGPDVDSQEVAIVSGRSCILLRTPYRRGMPRTDEAGSPRVQWFNNENSATMPPDPAHVFDLDWSLPGTAISVRFTLDPAYLRQSFSAAKSDDDQL